MVTNDESAAAVARRHDINVRWRSAKAAIWRLDAKHALQIDLALRGGVDQLLTRIAGDHGLAVEIRGLALLAWDELCETPDPRKQPPPIEA